MIIKSITYKNIDGQLTQEDYGFQITEAEFTKVTITRGGPAYLEQLRTLANITEEDVFGRGKEIMDVFDTLLGDAVGKREGDLFIKNEDIRKRFMYSGAYDAFFMDLIGAPDSGAQFLRKMLPGNAAEAIDKAMAEAGLAPAGDVAATQPTPEPSPTSVQAEAYGEINTPELQAAAPQLAEAGKDEEPKWLQEGRYATSKELMRMGPEETRLAMKMKNDRAFG